MSLRYFLAENNKAKINLKLVLILAFILIGTLCAILLFQPPKLLLIDDFEGEISSKTVDFGSGAGSFIDVAASEDIKYHGKQSIGLKYDSVTGGFMWLARGYDLDVKDAAKWSKKPDQINWPKFKALCFYMYGENSGASLAVDIIDSGFEYFRFMVKDDFSGWKKIVCPFDKFFPRGDWQPQKAQANAKLEFPLKAFQFEPRSIGKGTLYFDYVHLENSKE